VRRRHRGVVLRRVANALALHGCRPDTVGLPPGSATVLVGGRNFSFKQYLLEASADRLLDARDAAPFKAINGDDPANIVNRTLLGRARTWS
jgi:hypothetical protein